MRLFVFEIIATFRSCTMFQYVPTWHLAIWSFRHWVRTLWVNIKREQQFIRLFVFESKVQFPASALFLKPAIVPNNFEMFDRESRSCFTKVRFPDPWDFDGDSKESMRATSKYFLDHWISLMQACCDPIIKYLWSKHAVIRSFLTKCFFRESLQPDKGRFGKLNISRTWV